MNPIFRLVLAIVVLVVWVVDGIIVIRPMMKETSKYYFIEYLCAYIMGLLCSILLITNAVEGMIQ